MSLTKSVSFFIGLYCAFCTLYLAQRCDYDTLEELTTAPSFRLCVLGLILEFFEIYHSFILLVGPKVISVTFLHL